MNSILGSEAFHKIGPIHQGKQQSCQKSGKFNVLFFSKVKYLSKIISSPETFFRFRVRVFPVKYFFTFSARQGNPSKSNLFQAASLILLFFFSSKHSDRFKN